MEYQGKLYGKYAGHYLLLAMTTDDVEQLVKDNQALKDKLQKAEQRIKQLESQVKGDDIYTQFRGK